MKIKMKTKQIILILTIYSLLVLSAILFHFSVAHTKRVPFPEGFRFGVSTSAYQIEGAWKEDGKGENIWDRFAHDYPNRITDHSNGDVACDSYHHIEEDMNNLEWLGVNFYRISLSWSRILPTGYINHINEAGVRYYNNLIDAMLARGIEPMVTIFHWDLPQSLQEVGGWPNPLIADYFVEYARLAFSLFGDRVKYWTTFNEPLMMCDKGYQKGVFAPGYTADGIAGYMCGRTLLVAHGRTYKTYYDEFHHIQNGRVGISLSATWFEPATNSTEDIEAAEIIMQMSLGWFAHPIFSAEGNYPSIMRQRVAQISKEENFPRSRLPPLSSEEIELIQGSADFLGVNHYSSFLASANVSAVQFPTPSFDKDIGAYVHLDPSWEVPPVGPSFANLPWGFRKLLNWIKVNYDNPEVLVTENGFPDVGQLQDDGRILYLRNYLKALLEAIYEDGCNIQAYFIWSLMDNYEWAHGYTVKFGLFQVNFTHPERIRTAKASARFFKQVIQQHSLEV